jgi:hypothetical protein
MSETMSIDCRAEADRCRALAQSSNNPYVRKSLSKIADSYGALADWIDAEVAAGRFSLIDR